MALMRRMKKPKPAESAPQEPQAPQAPQAPEAAVSTDETPLRMTEDDAPSAVSDWEARYTAEHAAFEAYKAEIRLEEDRRKREDAYRKILKDAGIPEKKIGTVLRLCDPAGIRFSEDGTAANADELCARIREEWREIIPSRRTLGAEVVRSPLLRPRSLTKDDIMSIRNRDERRNAIAANMELFIQ